MVEGSLLFVVNQIEELAKFTAGINRLESFQSKVEQVTSEPVNNDRQLVRAGGGIVISNADLYTPKARIPVIRDLSLTVSEDDRILVVGPSGCGKTSLMRMISGLWTPSAGLVNALRQEICFSFPRSLICFWDLFGSSFAIQVTRIFSRTRS